MFWLFLAFTLYCFEAHTGPSRSFPKFEFELANPKSQALLQSGENGYVTCNLQGQLGNQMFQIAAAIGYALDHNCRAVFPLQKIKEAAGGWYHAERLFHRLDTSDFPTENLYIYNENEFTHYTIYSEIPYEKGIHICLNGGFQTGNYFQRHADYIREIFAPSEQIREEIYSKYGELLKIPTVALHIRTFTSDGRDPNQTIGEKGWKYFKKAMSYFSDEYTFLVFSDDIDWVKTNFPETGRNVVFIEGNISYIDLYFMSFCNHQILPPESTFSWWSGWLNTNPNKIVIGPLTWANRFDTEILPSEWIKIDIDQL